MLVKANDMSFDSIGGIAENKNFQGCLASVSHRCSEQAASAACLLVHLFQVLDVQVRSVCNAEKLIHFTAVTMSHSGLVLSSLFCEILNV
jgi:hypothetical protein